jgi:hypothetical protein
VTTKQSTRPKFFENQYLGAADLTAAVDYTRLTNARHLLGAHTWGIATGLQIVDKPSAAGGGKVDAFVQPGFAWDGFGRPIVVLAPFKIPSEKFKSIVFDAAIDGGSPEGRLVEVWLRYAEQATHTARPGFEVCFPVDQYARVDEFFQVEVGELNLSEQRDRVAVAGKTVDAREALKGFEPGDPTLFDESIPHQTFPDPDENARWLIPLGSVRWKPNPIAGQPGNFVERTPADLNQSRNLRRYSGVVAGSVQSSDRRIRLRDRFKDYSQVLSDDLVWVEGNLRVEGDARLFGGKLDLRKTDGQHNGAPLSVQRAATPTGVELQLVIGEKEEGKNSFSVGPVVANVFKGKLTVRDDGNLGVGTVSPVSTLQIKGDLAIESMPSGAPRALPPNATMIWNDGTWLRLNQNLNFTKPIFGVHTPGLFAPGSLNVGGASNWGDPGPGNVWVTGNIGVNTLTPSRRVHVEGTEIHSGGVFGGFSFGNRNTPLFVEGPANGERWVWYADAGRARLWSGGDKLCITPDGNVGVNNISPTERIHVVGNRIRLDNGGKRIELRTDGTDVDLQSTTHNLYLRSNGPGGNNNVMVNPFPADGFLGVGLIAPQCKLHVQAERDGDADLVTSYVALIDNVSGGNSADVLALKIGAANAGSGNNFVTFFAGANAVGRIEGNGAGGVGYLSTGADFAECLPRLHANEVIEAGDIVGVFEGKITKRTKGAHHLAAITRRPVVVGNVPRRDEEHLYDEVALVGQVSIKVRGAVNAGDFIVPSGLNDGSGVAISPEAMTLSNYSQVVGRAWESAGPTELRAVNVAIGFHSATPLETMRAIASSHREEIESLKRALEKLQSDMDAK